jgi:purine nucleosidase
MRTPRNTETSVCSVFMMSTSTLVTKDKGQSIPIILDCDPGADDAVLLLMALACPDAIKILGITTVCGNAPLSSINDNVCKVVELSGRTDIPVYAGCPRPMIQRPSMVIHHSYYHGEGGLKCTLPPPTQVNIQPIHAVQFILDTLRTYPIKVTLSVSGPMTNIALCFIQDPSLLLAKVQEIVCMGGSSCGGNVTAAAEFNMYADPHAAHVVLNSGIPIKMIGFHATQHVVTSQNFLDQLRSMNNMVGPEVSTMLSQGVKPYMDEFGLTGRPIHDACIIAYLLQPHLFHGEFAHVAVVYATGEEESLGATIINTYPKYTGSSTNPSTGTKVWVCQTIDVPPVLNLILDLLRTYRSK